MTIAVLVLCFATLFCGVVLYLLGKHGAHDNVDLYPPPGPPRPAPAPKKVTQFPPVKVSDIPKAWRHYVVEPPKPDPFNTSSSHMIISAETPPPAPRPGQTITFAPWMTEEQKQRIISNWRKENFE